MTGSTGFSFFLSTSTPPTIDIDEKAYFRLSLKKEITVLFPKLRNQFNKWMTGHRSASQPKPNANPSLCLLCPPHAFGHRRGSRTRTGPDGPPSPHVSPRAGSISRPFSPPPPSLIREKFGARPPQLSPVPRVPPV